MASARIDRVLGFEHGLPPGFGVVAAVVGLVWLVLGWRLHRVTVVVTGFLLGAFIGQLVARWVQVDRAWGVLLGGAALSLLADPLYKVMVFVLGGIALGLGLGEGVRRLIFSGGFILGFIPGFFGGGLLSLWKLRLVVIFSTAFIGSLALWWGIAVTLCGAWYPALCDFHQSHAAVSVVILALTFVVGCVVQLHFQPQREREGED